MDNHLSTVLNFIINLAISEISLFSLCVNSCIAFLSPDFVSFKTLFLRALEAT